MYFGVRPLYNFIRVNSHITLSHAIPTNGGLHIPSFRIYLFPLILFTVNTIPPLCCWESLGVTIVRQFNHPTYYHQLFQYFPMWTLSYIKMSELLSAMQKLSYKLSVCSTITKILHGKGTNRFNLNCLHIFWSSSLNPKQGQPILWVSYIWKFLLSNILFVIIANTALTKFE